MKVCSTSRSNQSLCGFTLIELIVAIAIFSIMSVAAYSGLRNFLAMQERIETAESEFAQIHSAIMLIEKDLQSAVPRSIRDEFGDSIGALVGDGSGNLALTRQSPGIPLDFDPIDLRRIDYFLEDNNLWRRSWHALDRVQQTMSEDRLLLRGVSEITWRFYQGRWQQFWPLGQDSFRLRQLPQAIHFEVVFDDGRRLDRTIKLESNG